MNWAITTRSSISLYSGSQAKARINWNEVTELGQIIAGQIHVELNATDIYVLRESQGGYSDVALAAWVFQEAVRQKLGQSFAFD